MPTTLVGALIQHSVTNLITPHFNNEEIEVLCPSPRSW